MITIKNKLKMKFQEEFRGSYFLGGVLLCYFLCWSLSVSLFWSDFCPIPDLYVNFPYFYFGFFSPSDIVCCGMHSAQMRDGVGWGWGGGVGSHGLQRIAPGFAHKTILVRNLMWQPESWCQVLVRIPVLQSTGGSSSVDHAWVWSRNCNCNPNFILISHVQMCSSIFAAVSLIYLVSTTRVSLPSMPST